MNPRFPVYIISKGRWESRHTSKAFDRMQIPYHIVVEPQEYEKYAKFIDSKKILVLPFSNLGQGGIPARNWVWNHSVSIGAKRHWIFDDNILSFYRLNQNRRIYIDSGTALRIIEDFVLRYKNVRLAGLNYMGLCKNRDVVPPFYLNTRVYSMILIDNSLTHMWRGRYNEDTDLSLRVMKDGDCTVLFNAFLGDKMATMTQRGGNTDELYAGDGRFDMAKSLQEQHPDVVKVSWKFNRWQHHVNYEPFKKNKLIRKDGWDFSGINNYGLSLKKVK